MAQYFNVVPNASGTFTLEEVPRICTTDGQRIQLVVGDVNNSSNGSQRLVTYTAAPQNRQAIFSPQTINLGNQIQAARLEQGQNVFIIKTNDLAVPPEILKPNTVNAHINENSIVSIGSNTGIKTECKTEGQQIQFMKIQNVNTTIATKQNTLQEKNQTAVLTRNNIQNNITSPAPVYVNSGSFNSGQIEKKVTKSFQNKNRQLTNSVVGVVPQVLDGNVITTIENRIQNSNVTGPKPMLSVCNKTIHSPRPNVIVRPVRAPNMSQVRPIAVVPPEMSKTSTRVQPPDMEHLSEQIKQAKFKQLQKQHIEKQRFQQNNTQRQLPNSLQHVQSSLNKPTPRFINSVQQRTQQISISSQQTQKPSMANPSLPSSVEHNTHRTSIDMEVDPPERIREKGHVTQQSSPRLEPENSSSESIAYLQKTISDPANAIVQHQIQGNTAKMLVMLATGEQRLITFDIPNEDCTVHDLLDQVRAVLGKVNIAFSGETQVSLVDDPALGINYIVDAGSGMLASSCEGNDGDSNSTQEIVSSTTNTENLSQNTNASDENSNTSSKNTEMFYKKNNERNVTKLEKIERDGSAKRPRGKGKGAASKPKPIHKEPECLTISSDEEEEGRKKMASSNSNTVLGNTSNAFDEEMDTILDKEPIITNATVPSLYDDLDEENSKDIGQLPQTAIECRTVRIGSYKYIPRENVVISRSGVRFSVPLLEDNTSFVTLDVKYRDIIKLLIHFGKTMPVLFFYTSTSTGAMIRELLGMQDPKGPYYDPAGKDHTHKRITLLPDKLPDDSKAILTSLFSRGDKIGELNPKEANDILIRASPRDCLQSLITRRSTQNVTTNVGSNDDIQTITVYPPPPAKGGIAINTEDYLCLAEDQFLNDVIIDFYLKYLTLEVLSESDQHRTHVFSSYFYKRLTSPHAQAAESTVPMTAAAKRHARVQKWTKNVNIFEKDFVIIPINEHAHWFLAIICFPGLVGKVSTCVAKTNENDVQRKKSKKIKELKAKAVTIGSTTITPVHTTITLDQLDDGSERDEAEGDDDEMEIESDEEDETETSRPEENKIEEQKETVKLPCILIFDSLAGASRARVVATLRDYLSCEHVAKLGVEKTFSKDTIKGACPKVPQQSNFTDCGLYVLQYVESFFKDPIKDYTLPIKTLKTWFEEIIVTRKREELSNLLIKLMNDTKGDRTINLPTVNFPTQDGKLKPKVENQTDAKATKSESENKRKSSDAETRIVSFVTENTESTNEIVSRTYQIIPFSLSSNSSNESNPTEILTEQKNTRSSTETMSYLKAKRIPRLVSRTQNQDDSHTTAKKHKGESFNSCK
ncbi:uncharacterized protein LOC105423416 isoform X3 [Pogonomyrmex barbatus]|uniref:Uncharacterized protein LOC105423416 isoform X3 n=1 Tax=Pogonomyrmex barbatus TaxID=144034 RepID=A0A6I9WIC3_9HYME|nr:uncharacterized protein LOC105423416 isoform X3 [Pogonomyrmex barbatus]